MLERPSWGVPVIVYLWHGGKVFFSRRARRWHYDHVPSGNVALKPYVVPNAGNIWHPIASDVRHVMRWWREGSWKLLASCAATA